MKELPRSIQEYLSTTDALYRAEVSQRYPDLKESLADPSTRTALMDWLSTDEAWSDEMTNFVVNSIEFLRLGASETETSIIRSFTLHPNPVVRCRAYEYLLTLYFPDKNHQAMLMLLQNMLADESDTVRGLASQYVKGMALGNDLRNLLERWLKTAALRGWQDTDSYESVENLLRE